MVTVQKSRGVARRVRGRSGHVKATARRVMLASSTQEAAGSTRRALLSGVGVAASLSILPFFSGEARAGLLDDLLERSAANKEANDKHRQRTFDANLARTRTVTDQTCAFPKNFFGCENYAEVAEVKFISDDIKVCMVATMLPHESIHTHTHARAQLDCRSSIYSFPLLSLLFMIGPDVYACCRVHDNGDSHTPNSFVCLSSAIPHRANAQTRQTARCAGAKSRTPFHLSLASNS